MNKIVETTLKAVNIKYDVFSISEKDLYFCKKANESFNILVASSADKLNTEIRMWKILETSSSVKQQYIGTKITDMHSYNMDLGLEVSDEGEVVLIMKSYADYYVWSSRSFLQMVKCFITVSKKAQEIISYNETVYL